MAENGRAEREQRRQEEKGQQRGAKREGQREGRRGRAKRVVGAERRGEGRITGGAERGRC